MSPPGRPKGERRSAQREGIPIRPPGRPKGERRSAQREGTPIRPPGRPKREHRSAQREGTPAAPALLVFAKAPIPGRVKTRLAAAIGDAPAAAVYRELAATTLTHAAAARRTGVVGAVELWCAGDPASAYFRGLAATAGAARRRQSEGDLGARMAHAIADALARHDAVLLVGTDCPLLDPAYLARAAELLTDHDAVLGPAEDGGYVLVGATRPLPFAGVRWSSPHALADTEAAFAATGVSWRTASTLWDVDVPADLARWRACAAAHAPAAR